MAAADFHMSAELRLVRELPSATRVRMRCGLEWVDVPAAELKRGHFGWLDVVERDGRFSRTIGARFFKRFSEFSKRLDPV